MWERPLKGRRGFWLLGDDTYLPTTYLLATVYVYAKTLTTSPLRGCLDSVAASALMH